MRSALQQTYGEQALPQGDDAPTPELVQVVPEHRLTARVTLSGAAGSPQTLYAKADARQRGEQTQQLMTQLWHSPASREGRLCLPRPLLWHAPSGLQWQAGVAGAPLLDLWPGLPASQRAALTAQVGATLATLHGCHAPAAPLLAPADLRAQLALVVAVLAQVQPAQTAALARLADGLAAGLADHAAAGGEAATLHGDLHPRNLLAQPGTAGWQLAVVDLDSVRRGPALLDVGAWLADGEYRALLAGEKPESAQGLALHFVAGYRAHRRTVAGPAAWRRALCWATAWQLLCQRAWRCVVNLKPGRYALVAPLLARAQALVDESRQRRPALRAQVTA